MKKKTVLRALSASIPVLSGYVVLGIGFGVLLRRAGYGFPWALAMSVFIYAGSLQYVLVSLISGGAGLLTTALTSFAVNARHIFYGISMIGRYRGAGAKKPYMIFGLTDETYAAVVNPPEGVDYHLWVFLLSFFHQCYWVTGSLIGSCLGELLPFDTAGIEFSMTALFIASFTEQWLTAKTHIPAVTGIAVSVASLLIFGPSNFLIPAMIGITLVLTVARRPLEAKAKKGENE